MHEHSTIVVIDSYEPIRVSLSHLLQDAGYRVMCLAQSPTADVLEALQPALIVLELQRACADAIILLLEQLRHCDATRAVPILLTTTDRRLLRNLAGPLEYVGCISLVKPFDVDRFLACVQLALGGDQALQSNEPHARVEGAPRPVISRSVGEGS